MAFAIVYDSETKMHRRTIADDEGMIELWKGEDGSETIVCHHSNAPSSFHQVLSDEKALIVEGGTKASHYHDWLDAIEKETGVKPARMNPNTVV